MSFRSPFTVYSRPGGHGRSMRPEEDTVIDEVEPVLASKLPPAFAQKIADKTEMFCHHIRVNLRVIPPRNITVNPVHERCIVADLFWQRAEEVAHPLLVIDVTSKCRASTMPPSALMLSLPRENSPLSM